MRSSRSISRVATAATCLGQASRRRPFRAAPAISSALALAELVLNRLELLAQVVLPLRVGHLLLRRRLDLALHLEQRDLARERAGDRLELRRQAVGLEDGLLLLRLACRAGSASRYASRSGSSMPATRPAAPATAGGQRQRAVDQLAEPPHVGVHLDRLATSSGARRMVARSDLLGEADGLGVRPLRPSTMMCRPPCALRHLPDGGDGADRA